MAHEKLHSSEHSSGGADPVDVKNLDGFSGDATEALLGDGTFATPDITTLDGYSGTATDVLLGDGSFGSVPAVGLISINQVAHNLAVEDVVYNNAGTWTKAQANNSDTLGVAIVFSVADVDNFTIVSSDIRTFTAHGFTVGQYLFLSETTAGLLTETEPTGISDYSNPVAYVVDANNLLVLPWRPTQAIPRSNDYYVVETALSTYNVSDIDEMILADATSNNIDVNLPTPSADYNGFSVTVKKIDSSANTVTLKSSSGDIDGVTGTTGQAISTQYSSITVVCDSVNYWIQ
jgi:hypothetical protein